MKVKLFTHIKDLDGYGASIIGQLIFKDIDIDYCDSADINDKVERFIISTDYLNYDKVFITDISVNKKVSEIIEGNEIIKSKLVLLDHHISEQWLNSYEWAHVSIDEDFKQSGTSLFYEYLLSNGYKNLLLSQENIKEFVELVRRYDTWEWKTKYNDIKAKKLSDLFFILGRERFVLRYLSIFKENRCLEFDESERLLLELEEEKLNSYIERKANEIVAKQFQGYNIGVVYAEQFISELGNFLAEKNPEFDFIMLLNIPKGISLRGIKNEINLGEIAKLFGGRGHKGAAGVPLPKGLKEIETDNIINLLINQ